MEGNRVQKETKKGPDNPKKKALLIGIGAAAVVVVGAYAGLCAWVGSSPAILKGVSVGGVSVGGMTQEQAKSALEDSLDQVKDLTVPLEYGTWSGSIPGTALSLNAEDCARQAWETGRSNFILQGGAYLGSLLGMDQEVDLSLDWSEDGQKQLNALLDEADQLAGGGITQAAYVIDGDQLKITKGVTGVAIDREKSEEQVKQALKDELEEKLRGETVQPETVTLTAHEESPQEPDFQAMYEELHTEPVDATVDPQTYQATDSVVGVDFDVEQAKTAYESAAEGETVSIPLTLTQPKETKESLQAKLFRDLLGSGTTNVSGSSNRKHNVKLSAEACNGVVLMPGEVFSYNNTTGSRSASKGYLSAPVYSGGASVDEVGGGICQTSSTIYYAVLHTTLEVVERKAHMYNTGYVDEGMDATVYYGLTDFRFKNNTNYPVKIVTRSYDQGGKRKLTVEIYGTNETGYYAVPKSTTYDWVSPTTQYKADSSIPRGTTKVDSKQNPYTGVSASTYRYIYDKNGNLVEKQQMTSSTYKMRPKTILYNPADGDPSTWVGGKPSQPQTQPETPATQPETPATQPETPVTQPETPATQPETPAETPTETPAETPAEQSAASSSQTA